MDLSKLSESGGIYPAGYRIPGSFELAGKSLDVSFRGGEAIKLEFSEAPLMEISPGDGKRYPYKCAKTGEGRYFVSYIEGRCCVSLAIDFGEGLVARHAADASAGASLTCGTIDPCGSGEKDTAGGQTGGSFAGCDTESSIFADSEITWSFGARPANIVSAAYGADGVSVSFPLMGADAPGVEVSGFTASRLAEGVYLQLATVSAEGRAYSVALVTDLGNMLCAGSVFGAGGGDVTHAIIGGYGYAKRGSPALRELNKYGKHAIVQFAPPPCRELAGAGFVFDMDDGDEFALDFGSGDRLSWSWKDRPPKPEKYSCLKADDKTYLLSYEIAGLRPRVNHTFVIDMENLLVTRIVSAIGKNKRWPYLMTTDIEFGSIRQNGAEYRSYPRHARTSDMIGNVVEWAYGSEMSTTHAYYDAHFYRLTFARSRAESIEAARDAYAFNNYALNLPSSDEPADYIKIKEGMYLVSLTEKNCEKLLGPAVGFRSNTLCFLQCYKGGGYVVGRAFGTSTTEQGDTDTNIMIGAFGYFIGAADDELRGLLTSPNPYVI